MSNNLDFQTLTTSQSNKEAAVNTALGQIDAILSDIREYEVDAASVTVDPTVSDWKRYAVYRISEDGASPPAVFSQIVFNSSNIVTRTFMVHNNTTLPLQIGGTLWIPAGGAKIFYYDGTTLLEDDGATNANHRHHPIRAASTGNVDETALNTGDTFDGITLANGDIVLLKDQTDATENGIYVVGNTASVRAWWFPTGATMYAGTEIPILEGTANAGKTFQLMNTAVLDTGSPAFLTQFDGLMTLGTFFGGTVSGATLLWQFVATDKMRLIEDLLGSQGYAGTAPSGGSAVFNINVNGVLEGTMTFADGVSTATFSFADDVDIDPGDRVDITSAASLNGIANVSTTLRGKRL